MARVGGIKLGAQGLEVSVEGLGCLGMSSNYVPVKPELDMIAIIHQAAQSSVTFLDTADIYGPHTNEVLLGKGGWRDKVELSTKFEIKATPEGKKEIRGNPEYVRAACEDRLKRLEIDCFDLYYQHRADTGAPIELTCKVGDLKKLVEEGKIKYIGLSEASA